MSASEQVRGSPSFAGRPFIEGPQGNYATHRASRSPSFAGRPFIEGRDRSPSQRPGGVVAVLYGTARHPIEAING